MLLISFGYLFFLTVFAGIGLFIAKIVDFYKKDYFFNFNTLKIEHLFLIGFFTLNFLLPIIVLIYPINNLTFLILNILGFSSIIINYKDFKTILIKNKQTLFWVGIFSFIFILISFISTSIEYDTGLYHIQTIKWYNQYGTVPGLANLHGRLGFNSIFHLFASYIDNWIFNNYSPNFTIGLILVIVFTIFWRSICETPLSLRSFFAALCILIINSYNKHASLYNDGIVNVLIILNIFYLLPKAPGKLFQQITFQQWILTAVISVIGICTKLSFLPFLIVWGISFLIWLLKNKNNFKNRILLITIIFLSFLTPHIIRHIIISGWLWYPIPYGKVVEQWGVPKADVEDEYYTTKGWSRRTSECNFNEAKHAPFLKWFLPWLKNAGFNFYFEFALIGILFFMIIFFIKKAKIKDKYFIIITLLSGILGIIYLIFTAPGFRFGGIYFYITGFSGLLAIYSCIERPLGKKIFLIICMIYIHNHIPSINYNSRSLLYHKLFSKPPTPPSNQSTITLEYRDKNKQIINEKMFRTYVSDQCFNNNLPCTPYIRGVKRRDPQDLGKGFIKVKTNHCKWRTNKTYTCYLD